MLKNALVLFLAVTLGACHSGEITSIQKIDIILPPLPTATLTIDKQGGPAVVIKPGNSFSVHWGSENSLQCQLNLPQLTGIKLVGDMTIFPDHPWYPTLGKPTTFNLTCRSKEGAEASASIVVVLGS